MALAPSEQLGDARKYSASSAITKPPPPPPLPPLFSCQADSGNNKVRKIDSRGYVTTVAGSGLIGVSNGVGTSVALYSPRGVAIDNLGYLYVSEFMSNRIQVIYLEAPTVAACDNTWHHVALTYGDGAPDAYKAYLDGNFVEEAALPQNIPANPTLYVGWNGNTSYNGGELFSGSIADLRVFSRGLEAWEVSDLAHPYFPCLYPGRNPAQPHEPHTSHPSS